MNKFLSLAGIALFVLLGCSSNDKFSCDKSINEWAHLNQSFFENAARDEITFLPLNLQRAAYLSLSPEKRYDLWMSKYSYILSDETYSMEEKRELKTLFTTLSADVYSNEKKREEFVSFASKWEALMRERFDWDDEKLFYSVGTWMTKDEFLDSVALQVNLSTKDGPVSGELDNKDCECIYSMGCGTGFTCQKKHIDCNKVTGCGIAGTSNCKGICL